MGVKEVVREGEVVVEKGAEVMEGEMVEEFHPLFTPIIEYNVQLYPSDAKK